MTLSTPTSTSSSPVKKSKSKTKAKNTPPETLDLSANFANNRKMAVGYDHEVYLQLTTGRNAEKTPNQLYLEERFRQRTTRALDPAILDPQGEPGPVDFECAEHEGVKERFR
ncbi:hypothetical protein BDV28DRAFT_10575 [Aspergillus coremiiformis]|uniref:Uncharacterized protein n=1 Tax=Aspergillus coremiiformis TaxID=138285 RepID=A0A5N6Z3D4_9EURO|nr:hypothetical protein BDV28DRAFT_10575 [Aspergillus coremiiformis]